MRHSKLRRKLELSVSFTDLYTELAHGWPGLLYMATTLAPLALDIPHYGMYKHTGGACMPPKDPAPPVSLRLPVRA